MKSSKEATFEEIPNNRLIVVNPVDENSIKV
nr:MAG TPA: hypothetical protein [Caudoviricetes sp.]